MYTTPQSGGRRFKSSFCLACARIQHHHKKIYLGSSSSAMATATTAATALYSDDIASVDAAIERFSLDGGLVVLRPRRRSFREAFHFTVSLFFYYI